MTHHLGLITYDSSLMSHYLRVNARLADNPKKGICDSLANCTKVSFQIDEALF